MATYNGERYIWSQLDSFLRQTVLPDELVVTDDCSTDGTVDIVRRFATMAPFRVRIIGNPVRVGVRRNFEIAMSECIGEVIFLSDQDDIWLPNKIDVVAGYMRTHRDMVVTNDQLVFEDLEERVIASSALSLIGRTGQRSRFIAGCCCAIRREWLEVILPIPEEQSSHDFWLVKLSDVLMARHIVPVVLQKHRRHGGNASVLIEKSRKFPLPVNNVTLGAWTAEAAFWCRVEARIESRAEILAKLGYSDVERYAGRARRRAAALGRRVAAMRERNWFRRKVLIAHNALIGDYQYFNGLRSLASDCIS